MDLEDDTTVLTTLKSFNSFISRPEHPQRLSEHSAGSGNLQSQYKRSMELLEAAERVQSKNRYLQLDQEKKQMELSHKRARFELERAASDSARDLENEVDRNQELLGRMKKLEDRETEAAKNLSEQAEANRALRKNLEGLHKKLEERDTRLNTANQSISCLKDEIRDLKQKIQNQDSTISTQTLENQELQEQLDLQHRKYQEVSQLCQSLQAAQSSCSEHIIKIKELERRLALQEQDITIVKTVKSEVARLPDLEKELKRLRDDNAFLRESRENCSLLKEEVEGLRRKLERMEKTKEELVNIELEKEAQLTKAQEETGTLKLQLQTVELELESLKKQQSSITDSNSSVTKEEVSILRQKIEDLEAERQRLEEQNNILEMRLERHNLQGDYDPVKTRVLHLKMNPTTVAKQQRQQEVESLREEVTRLRELVRSLQDGGALVHSQDDANLRKQMESAELRNQRLKEVFQRKIQEFRTVCYVLTGYQIDITTENQYRLSSVYAEHMDDSLLFKKGASSSNRNLGEPILAR
ncbi:hypothetical protein PAMP_021367 [Pampus punctatissimus]